MVMENMYQKIKITKESLKTKSLMEKGNIQKKDISIKVILKMTNLMAKENRYYLKKIQFI